MGILEYIERVKRENEGPRITAQEPRIGLSDGLSADYPLGDLHKRMQEAKRAWRTYKGSRHRSSRKLSYPQFFKLWAAENMAEGGRIGLKPGGIVEPGVVNYGKKDKMTIADLKEAGIKSKARYYIPSKDKYALSTKVLDENARWTGKFKTELFDSVKDRETFAKNRLEKQKLTVKKLQEESIKAQAKIDKQVNNWTKNWFEKNTKTFKVGNYDDTIAKFAKAWAIESKKAVYQAPSIWKRALTTENGLPILRDAKIFGMDSPDMVKRGQSVAGAQERILDSAQAYYKRVFHSGLLKNSTLRNNVKDFMIWAAKDKTGAGWRGLLAKASDWLTEDTIKLMGEIDMSVLPAKSRAEILRYHFPKTADNYLKKVNMVENIRKETEKAVEKLAGKEPGYIRKMLEADRRKLRKIFNTDKLPLVFKYSGDHMLGLREAQLLGDEKFAKKAVENLIGRTFAQNSELGGLSFGNQRRGLTKEFANPKTTSARKAKIVERLNILAEEFIPGEVKYSLGTKNNLIAKPLKIQTQPERFASYFRQIAKTKEGAAAIKKQHGSLKNLINQIDQGKATLIANSLNEGKFPKKICIKKSKEVCGVDFANKYPKDYLRKVGAMEEVGKFFKSAKGLNIAKGVLNTAKYWTSPMTLGGGEAIYSTLAGWNERTKGASWNESINEAMWFLPGKKARDVSELVGYEGHGYSPLFSTERHRLDATPDQKEMFKAMDLAGNIEKQKALENRYYNKAVQIAEIEENIKKGTVLPDDVHRLAMLKKQLDLTKTEFERIEGKGEEMFEEYKTKRREVEGTTSLSEEQLYKPFKNLKARAEQFIVDKYNKSLQDKYLQGDVASGKVWSKTKSLFGRGTIQSLLGLNKTVKEAEMLRSMDPKERYLYNINARGLGHIRGPEDLTSQQWDVALQKSPELQYAIPMRGVNYRAGGLANLTRTVAPDSGPMQGLASTPEYETYRKEYKWQT